MWCSGVVLESGCEYYGSSVDAAIFATLKKPSSTTDRRRSVVDDGFFNVAKIASARESLTISLRVAEP